MNFSQVFKVERSYIFLYHKYMLDVICVGDPKLDIFLTIDENNTHVKLDNSTRELRFGHGEKIEVVMADNISVVSPVFLDNFCNSKKVVITDGK